MRRSAALLTLLFCLIAGSVSAQPAMLVLDASGSMWGRIEGRTKIEVAREVVGGLMSRWPAGRPIGLMAYGHRRSGDCADIEVLAQPAPDPTAITALVRRITPRGRTPMADAVRLAAEALGPSGGSVILVSDGIETCHPDPCAVAQAIARSGVRLVIHTVGFGISDPAAAAQLRCMAEATGGRAVTAQDANELAEALDRAAAAPTPGPRAAAPRPEPVPQPRLIVTLRLCATCEPMTGDAGILLRRGEDVVATNGDPFGRFFDLDQGDYQVSVETPYFTRGPVTATVPGSGVGRAEVVLDAGWLVGDVRSEPSGADVTDRAGLEWEALGDLPDGDRRSAEAQGGPSFLVPVGTHRLTARIGTATGSAEGAVTAGEVVVLRIPIRFGTIALRREGFGNDAPRITITDLGKDEVVFDDWPGGDVAEIRLAPGRYRIAGDADGRTGTAELELAADASEAVTLRATE
ncbi:VWA domain-containing protein [Roseomonas sp. HJA6]|uniref:VWA domain-containing protein n=1 Tax=Roseomonas alba TaxID=2846776 RepID=A0ABS7AGG7_9PROT|nr:VWA domain-containing protein [Neoroseomonas alba]MBW6400430.1 VWA domain-containing protein [Neoroseomonas alba]